MPDRSQRTEPIWLTRLALELIHLEQLAEHGGRPGLRDETALESALARPRQQIAYNADADLADLAALLCLGIVQGHPFVDGNKRVGFLAAYTFLRLNGHNLQADDDEVVAIIDSAASGSVTDADLAAWIRSHR